jgi:hypothetical protein
MMFMIPEVYQPGKKVDPNHTPDAEAVAAMMKYNEDLAKAGVLLSLDGLQPAAKGARISFSDEKPRFTDGPFIETKEVVGGYWMIDVKSKEEAVEWATRCPAQKGDVIELRQVFEMSDFPADVQKAAAGFPEMQAQSGQGTKIFVNLPVKDLKRSVEFFTKLGYKFNAQFTDENATCMIVGEDIFVMLLVEKFFKTFTPKAIADAKKSTEALVALSTKSREEVNRIVETALAAGAKKYSEPKDHGFMYQWGFEDLDGHIWEYLWMDPSHVQS